jgi:hypothetical protein
MYHVRNFWRLKKALQEFGNKYQELKFLVEEGYEHLDVNSQLSRQLELIGQADSEVAAFQAILVADLFLANQTEADCLHQAICFLELATAQWLKKPRDPHFMWTSIDRLRKGIRECAKSKAGFCEDSFGWTICFPDSRLAYRFLSNAHPLQSRSISADCQAMARIPVNKMLFWLEFEQSKRNPTNFTIVSTSAGREGSEATYINWSDEFVDHSGGEKLVKPSVTLFCESKQVTLTGRVCQASSWEALKEALSGVEIMLSA